MLEQVILFTILMGFLISVLLSPILIPFLRRLKFGQSIREEGPKSHQKKSGTPTMGGVMIDHTFYHSDNNCYDTEVFRNKPRNGAASVCYARLRFAWLFR